MLYFSFLLLVVLPDFSGRESTRLEVLHSHLMLSQCVFVCKRRKSCRRNLGKLHLFFLVSCKLWSLIWLWQLWRLRRSRLLVVLFLWLQRLHRRLPAVLCRAHKSVFCGRRRQHGARRSSVEVEPGGLEELVLAELHVLRRFLLLVRWILPFV
jgi:hypothetical protein